MSKKIWSYIIGILCIVGGVYFIISPEESFSNIIYYLGIVLIIVGTLKIVAAVIDRNSLTASKIFSGLVNLLFGIILVTNSTMTVKFITIFLGIYLILTSISSLLLLVSISRTGNISYELAFQAIVKLILGIIVFTTPIVSIVFSGIVVGVILIVAGVYTIIKESKQKTVYKVKVK